LVSHRYSTDTAASEKTELEAQVRWWGEARTITGVGNGPIDAFVEALGELGVRLKLTGYAEHAIERGSDAQAAAYIELETADELRFWGCGIDPGIVSASLRAVASAVNTASASAQVGA